MQIPMPAAGETAFFRQPDGRLTAHAHYGNEDGFPVLACHGTPGSRFMYRIAGDAAAAFGLRLIAPDRPGFGRSSPHEDRTLRSTAEDALRLLDGLGVDQFAVAGISGGAPYAVALAAIAPDRVAASALVSPVGPLSGPFAPPDIGRGQRLLIAGAPRIPLLLSNVFRVGRLGLAQAPQAFFSLLAARASESDRGILARPEVRAAMLSGLAEGLATSVSGATTEIALFSRPWDVDLRAATAPAVLWQGLDDRSISIPAALALARHLPTAELHQVPDAGHFWIFDNIDRVLETVASLVAGSRAGATSPFPVADGARLNRDGD